MRTETKWEWVWTHELLVGDTVRRNGGGTCKVVLIAAHSGGYSVLLRHEPNEEELFVDHFTKFCRMRRVVVDEEA